MKAWIIVGMFLIGCTPVETPPPVINDLVGCSLDSDCVRQGCSGQICGANTAEPAIFTTCEYREWYSCFDLSECSCNSGACSWDDNEEFRACMDEKQ